MIACRLLPRFVGPLTEDQTNAAMSHTSFDDIAHLVTEFLTRHPEIWWIDKHYVWNVHPRVSVSLLHF